MRVGLSTVVQLKAQLLNLLLPCMTPLFCSPGLPDPTPLKCAACLHKLLQKPKCFKSNHSNKMKNLIIYSYKKKFEISDYLHLKLIYILKAIKLTFSRIFYDVNMKTGLGYLHSFKVICVDQTIAFKHSITSSI